MNILSRAFTVLEFVEKTSGTKAKAEYLRKQISYDPDVHDVIKEYLQAAFDPFVTFGITVTPGKGQPITEDTPDFDDGSAVWDDIKQLLSGLSERKITGGEAKAHADLLIDTSTPLQAKWIARLINKNPLLGLAEKGVLKIFPGLFEPFECQLAQEWDGETVPDWAAVEPKYDGLRALFFFQPDGKAFVVSRNGKPLYNVNHIVEELKPLFSTQDGWVLDGELFNTDWASSVSAARSEETGDTTSRYKVFDCIPLEDFKAKECKLILGVRQTCLAGINALCAFTQFKPGTLVKTPEQVLEATKGFVAEGYEGGVLKDLDAQYQFKRSVSWSKIKFFNSADLPITGFQEGEAGSKHEGRLGALFVEDGTVAKSKVGSGFTDAQRTEIWANRENLLGKTIEVKYQSLTPDSCLLFPVFLRFRDDK